MFWVQIEPLDSPKEETYKIKDDTQIVVSELAERGLATDLTKDDSPELKLNECCRADRKLLDVATTTELKSNASWASNVSDGGGSDKGCMAPVQLRSYSDEEEVKGEEGGGNEENSEEESLMRFGETAALSESCLFTTSNDDDSSSSTTEPTSTISPNGSDGFFFAVKEVSLLDQGSQGKQSIIRLEHEISLLSQFEHENIVQYYGTAKDDSKLYIFLELVTKGSLLNLYLRYHLRDSQVSAYTRQILHGLEYLHDRNVIHRDIKCANILVDASGSVKLADFGLAKANKLNDVKSCKGTSFWMAPEVVNQKGHGYGLPADIWSLGCTVLEMLTRQIPYHYLECMQALFRIGRGEPPAVPDSLSKDARDFILQCLQVNPGARPTAAVLLHHPFVKRILPTHSGSASPRIGRRF
ncbi:Mitogen-activated protein kinase kinase kinase 1 [Hibiscus syriacus]|uniref:Mitogen-activated protein kinase kinase kinase 1 n=1 Tax=Hibiscus syriacus TaxID=106335 RepID=A0A6A2X3A0_HIBSY|nr:Mitogen-activated protein kinase kinase kinase 1 [Hibiscus syriacus]